MIVLKFGGTSVATADSLLKVRDILSEKSKHNKLAVVVSALGGVTNKLIECAKLAEAGDNNYETIFNEIEQRHLALCNALLPVSNRNGTLTKIKILLNDLGDIFRGVFLIKELSLRSSDHIVSYGEILSSNIIYDFLKSEGLDISYLNTPSLIKTNNQFGNASADKEASFNNITEAAKKSAQVSISPGFVASSSQGNYTTTLGRGGSDYTAALIASALDAEGLEIWTDVSGMMTANPKLVRLARPINVLTYEEAMELSHFGAKVIYPPTIQPALDKEIPIYIKNTFAPNEAGTLITNKEVDNNGIIKGITSIDEVALCTLSGSGMIAVPKFSYRLFRALSQNEVNVIMITQASSEHSITVAVSLEDAEKARKAIDTEFSYEIEHRRVNPLVVENNLSIVALVGSRMKSQVGISANLFETLSYNGINVRAIAQGSTELNISVVIDKKNLRKGLNSIHESFFLSDKKKINLFMVGAGNVGRVFLNQIKAQSEYLAEHHQLDVIVAGLSNSRKMLFKEQGIELDTWQAELDKSELTMTMEGFIEQMKELNLRNTVFIDCTASDYIPPFYEQILKESISIVTPNKIACSSSQENYELLNKTAKRYKSRFLFETNVGAGLPVISTLNDLIKSGDRVHKIQAVLSGTLNFIFNNYDGTQKFSEVVKAAQEAGFTEPDPRIDLSGVDVMRKILILARESGYKMELSDIDGTAFVPKECMEADSVDQFLEKLDDYEEVFQKMYADAASQNKRIKYVATFDSGKAKTGLETFSYDHPFYELQGKDNIVLYYTDRYSEQPLVVKGAGAGADVTASGIFADIMRIASA
ncbi:MAG: bifunctional aspartate kinase/homoserine dehydrogenase I [Balneolaceae bacterium]